MSDLRIILNDDQLDELARRVADQLGPALIDRQAVASEHQRTYRIDPLRLYGVEEAAEVLGITTGTLYNMSDEELPRQGCGRGGGKVKFYGRDLIAHLVKNYSGKHHPHAVQETKSGQETSVLLHLEKGASGVR